MSHLFPPVSLPHSAPLYIGLNVFARYSLFTPPSLAVHGVSVTLDASPCFMLHHFVSLHASLHRSSPLCLTFPLSASLCHCLYHSLPHFLTSSLSLSLSACLLHSICLPRSAPPCLTCAVPFPLTCVSLPQSALLSVIPCVCNTLRLVASLWSSLSFAVSVSLALCLSVSKYRWC